MQEGRWTTITPSQFAHEREALGHVQALLPDTEPYRVRIPFVQAAVFLSKPGLQVGLCDHHLHGIYGPEPAPGHQPGQLPTIGSFLKRPPEDERQRAANSGRRLGRSGRLRGRLRMLVATPILTPRPFRA